MNKKAFTLVEILVVISIMTLVTISGGNYFFDFLDNKEISIKTYKIDDKIKSLDLEVRNHKIYDYKIQFSNTGRYIVYKNIFDTNKNQTIENSFSEVKLNNYSGEEWYRNIYKEHKLFSSSSGSSDTLNLSLENIYDYKINGYLSGSTEKELLNEIEIINFDKEDNILYLESVQDNLKTNSPTEITNFEIINIGGKKSFSGTTATGVYLYFDNKGKEGYLKITK